MTPPPLTADERAAIAERITERAAIMEHDGGLPRVDADAQARAGMRAYRVQVDMGKGQPARWGTMLAPGCDLLEAIRIARRQFGDDRVVDVVEQQRRA